MRTSQTLTGMTRRKALRLVESVIEIAIVVRVAVVVEAAEEDVAVEAADVTMAVAAADTAAVAGTVEADTRARC